MPGKRCATGKGPLRVTAALNAMLIRELLDGPCTAAELRATTGLGVTCITGYLRAMYRKKCIRVAGWERDTSGKQSIRVFGFGDAPDAQKAPTARQLGHQNRLARERATFRILTQRQAA